MTKKPPADNKAAGAPPIWNNRIIGSGSESPDDLLANPKNWAIHPQAQQDALLEVLQQVGWVGRVLVNKKTGFVVDGHARVALALRHEQPEIPVDYVELSEDEENLILATFDMITEQRVTDPGKLRDLLQDIDLGDGALASMAADKLRGLRLSEEDEQKRIGSLQERFLVPPFTVLDARQGYWQDRKRAWISVGIQSELGRGDNLLKFSETAQLKKAKKVFGTEGNATERTGTSIFDPVLTELAYRWFCPPKGSVLDPFAGGSVRGIVAGKLGFDYLGIELRPEQIVANEDQAKEIFGRSKKPAWIEGDAAEVLATGQIKDQFDFILSCPPYFDLEVYSDLPGELSAASSYKAFLKSYGDIVKLACQQLKDDRFACFVVGDIRDKQGIYRNFVSDTISVFLQAGLKLYNEAILVTALGSLPIRIGKQFPNYRKLGKTHQNVLVFVKGDPGKAAAACGEIEVGDLWPEE